MNLNIDSLGTQTMHFNTVAEDVEAAADVNGQRQGKLMRLATLVDLDSRISVSFILSFA